MGCMQTAIAQQGDLAAHTQMNVGSDDIRATQRIALQERIGYVTLVNNEDAETCAALNAPDGADFNWDAIESSEMLEACLLELATNVASVDRMARWLREQGFFDVGSGSTVSGQLLLEAHWNIQQSGSDMPFEPNWPFWVRWLNRSNTYDVSVTYRDGIPTEANASKRTK